MFISETKLFRSWRKHQISMFPFYDQWFSFHCFQSWKETWNGVLSYEIKILNSYDWTLFRSWICCCSLILCRKLDWVKKLELEGLGRNGDLQILISAEYILSWLNFKKNAKVTNGRQTFLDNYNTKLWR